MIRYMSEGGRVNYREDWSPTGRIAHNAAMNRAEGVRRKREDESYGTLDGASWTEELNRQFAAERQAEYEKMCLENYGMTAEQYLELHKDEIEARRKAWRDTFAKYHTKGGKP